MTPKKPGTEKRSSKSQRKRDMVELRQLAKRLTELNQEQINKINDIAVKESVERTRKIKKGSAYKRQIQYTAKLLSKIDTFHVRQVIDTVDARTSVYTKKLRKLENWRDCLIHGDKTVLSEILLKHPDCDHQTLRQLTRNAIKEKATNEKGPHFRKLFQFLKQFS